MKHLTIAAVILLATITMISSTSKATIDKKLTYPKNKVSITTNTLTYPFQFKPNKSINVKDWMNWVQYCSKKYGIDPYFALAVAETESSNSHQRFRFGKMGRTFYGPFGIHKCFLNKWDIDNPYVNTEVGIRALARYGDQRSALKRYNTGDRGARFERYFKRIKYLESRNRSNHIFKVERPEVLVYKTR
jgi:hypothetical protein